MPSAQPRYFKRLSGLWHQTWSPIDTPRVTSICGLSVCPEEVDWTPVEKDGRSLAPTERRCAACFRFLPT